MGLASFMVWLHEVRARVPVRRMRGSLVMDGVFRDWRRASSAFDEGEEMIGVRGADCIISG